ncbi:MAG: hypothetical protein AB7H70_01870 [Rhodospirillaceae bacterium]
MTAPLYIHLPNASMLPALGPEPFKVLLIAESIVLDEWRVKICEDLARSGCRYLVAWGQDCKEWSVAMGRTGENLVVTGATVDEPLAEAMWLAVHEAEHPTLTLHALVIAHVTPHARRDEILFQFHSAAMREKPGL